MDEHPLIKFPSKFQLWFDAHHFEFDQEAVEPLSRISWNACAKEAVRMAREIKISSVDNKEDILIGLLAQLKDSKI